MLLPSIGSQRAILAANAQENAFFGEDGAVKST